MVQSFLSTASTSSTQEDLTAGSRGSVQRSANAGGNTACPTGTGLPSPPWSRCSGQMQTGSPSRPSNTSQSSSHAWSRGQYGSDHHSASSPSYSFPAVRVGADGTMKMPDAVSHDVLRLPSNGSWGNIRNRPRIHRPEMRRTHCNVLLRTSTCSAPVRRTGTCTRCPPR